MGPIKKLDSGNQLLLGVESETQGCFKLRVGIVLLRLMVISRLKTRAFDLSIDVHETQQTCLHKYRVLSSKYSAPLESDWGLFSFINRMGDWGITMG